MPPHTDMRVRLATGYRNPTQAQLDPAKTTPTSLSQDSSDYDRAVPSDRKGMFSRLTWKIDGSSRAHATLRFCVMMLCSTRSPSPNLMSWTAARIALRLPAEGMGARQARTAMIAR